MECRGFAVDAEWVTAMVAGWLGDGYGGWVWLSFGTGEGLLWYGICVPCSKRLPGVRDAFSEAFGVKNRRFRYGRNIRCSEQPPVVRDASWIFGTAPPSLVRNRSLDAKKGHHRNNTKKQDKSCDLSCLVAGAGLEPTTSGL